jgi:MFS family permease
MKSSLASYLEVLRAPGALKLLLAAFPARFSYGMISLSIFFKVQGDTGSIAAAGLATGVNALAGSATAGLRGAVIDRYGMRWPIRIMVPSYGVALILMSFGSGKTELILLAMLMGFAAPPINLSVRPLWRLTVPTEKLRVAFALDTAAMNSVGVVAPVVATTLSLQVSPNTSLRTCAALIFLSGIFLARTWQVRTWKPEVKEEKTPPIWRVKAIQLLALEGVILGMGWGAFDIAIPALGTLEGAPQLVGTLFAVMSLFNVIGGLIAGSVSRKISPLRGFTIIYLLWAISSIPLAFMNFDWTMAIVLAFLAFFGGVQQVFYWEITEAVRPKGTAVQAMAWLWTIEGTAASIGIAIGGYISEHLSPRYCLGAASVALLLSFILIRSNQSTLSRADRIPTSEEDQAAMENTIDTTK